MCDCKTELEVKLLERVKEALPDSTNHSVEIEGYVFGISGNSMFSCQAMTVAIKHTVTVKKTGLQKQKTEKQKMMASYCMFCGEKRVKD